MIRQRENTYLQHGPMILYIPRCKRKEYLEKTRKTAIILKFFIHKLDASLQITLHGQNHPCNGKKETKPKAC